MPLKPFLNKIFLIVLILYSSALLAKNDRSSVIEQEVSVKEAPPPIGLYTPNLRQPGGLIAFGENILPKGQSKVSLFTDNFAGPGSEYVDLVPSFLYGITDDLSLNLAVPYAAYYQAGGQQSSGLEDTVIQLEYAYYTNSTNRYEEQATIVVNGTVPTGSANKQPPTGNGSPTYFLGATYNRTYVNWLFFVSPGVSVATSYHGTKSGNSYLYQFGVGRNIVEIDKNWIVAWVAELDGQYLAKTKVNGVDSPDTGGNIIFATPSLSITGKQLSVQAGIGLPVFQNLNGEQTRTNYLLAANMSWVF